MALVAGSSGGRGGVRLIFSGLLQRLLGLRSRRIAYGTGSDSHTSGEDDDTSPLIEDEEIPRGVFSGLPSRSIYVSDSSSARMPGVGATHQPFGLPDWHARNLFDVGTARHQSAKRGLEMTTGTRHVTRLPREHVTPPVVVVDTSPGQHPMLQIPVTHGLLASVLAQGARVHIDGTAGVITTANRAPIPASSDSKGGQTQWMKVFRGLLLAHFFFALPLIVIFFPRYEKGPKNNLLLNLFDTKEEGAEKLIVLALFVVHASLGSLGVLLAHIADGPVSRGVVGSFTLCIIISVVGFIDYIFLKTLPHQTTYVAIFVVHFILMLLLICGLWAKFVGFSPCCCSELDSRHRLPV